MTKAISDEKISRRKALSILGFVAALGVAISGLTESEADAQEAAPAPATPGPSTNTGVGTTGMKRRQNRRGGRHQRRHQRRTGQPATPAPAPQ